MELSQIRHFVAIVDTGSFTKAAMRAFVSQPALSASISKLEDELGVQLLYRNPKGITLSAAGKRLLVTARDVLASCSKVKAELQASSTDRSIRIGVLRTLPTSQIVSLLSAFQAAHPDVSVLLYDGCSSELDAKLAEHKIAACITSGGEIGPGQCSETLYREKYALLVDRGHRLAGAGTAAIKDLDGERFIVRTHCETYEATSRLFVEQGIRPQVVFRTDQDDRALALIAAGFGVALMPTIFETKDVSIVPLRDFDAERSIEIRWNANGQSDELETLKIYVRSQKNW